ncbi:heparinase II/III family protein [Kribbella sp. NPDC056345]|uniref:heparinase II/III domain-containing protein n=1 Tax=Kribbella sp. NPDC056345 TaxID=3345789 RepID=UPI0035D8A2CF
MAEHKGELRRRVGNTVALVAVCVLICGIAFAGAIVFLMPGEQEQVAPVGAATPDRRVTQPVAAPLPVKPPGTKPAAKGYPCQGYSGLQKKVPLKMVLEDTFAWGNNPPYKAGNGAGDIKWESNPYQDPSWHLWLHSLRWLGNGIDHTKAGNAAARTHTLAIIRDWIKDNPFPWKNDASASESTMHRTNVLICARQALLTGLHAKKLPAQYKWLDEALLTHAQYMIDHWSGSRNHGTDESIALFGVGCTFGREDLMKKAVGRLNEGVVQSIDSQGTTNEQSVGYAGFNYRLWGRAAAVVRGCGIDPGPAIDARRKLLAEWMALATKPNGELFQIGNSTREKVASVPGTPWEFVATKGKSGPRPEHRTGIFKGGFIFGRTGWGEKRPFDEESAYSIRFGPSKKYHGHDDHMSINYNWHGQDVLIDPGYYGYKQGDLQNWAPSQAAHNVMTIPTAQGKLVPTRLVGSVSTPNSDYYELADEPAEGVSRSRDILVLKDPDVVIALDRGESGSNQRYETLWHLPPGQTVTVQSPTTAVATGAKMRTHLFQIPFGATTGTTTVEQGKSNPAQGWYLADIFNAKPAPVVKFTQTGQNARILSVIAPAASGEQVSYSTRSAGTNFFVDLTVGTRKVTVKVAPDGRLTRMN